MRHPAEALGVYAPTQATRFLQWGLLPVGLAAILTVASGVPSRFSPFSVVVVLPLLLVADFLPQVLVWIAPALFMCVLYAAWTFPAGSSAPTIPPRSTNLYVILGLLSLAWCTFGFGYGVRYQGLALTTWLFVLDALLILALAGVLVANHIRPTDKTYSAFHIGLFVWIGWASFPWFGELP